MLNGNGNKFKSRKFITLLVALVFTMAAAAGKEIPVQQIALVDSIAVIYIIVQGYLDKKKNNA